MDMKQFLSWNLTAVPCARLSVLVRTGTADLTGPRARKGKTRGGPGSLFSSRWHNGLINGQKSQNPEALA
jgi:hypothetical protein